ncbi:MAG TPA: hypothetical protein VKR21_11010, partial [Solirubrobacteraceae bacterium]|nr:hypothetical protein [Solirubrobacteraceae bacterium]
VLALMPAPLRLTGGEPTLDDRIVDAWEGLTAREAVACPVCEGELEPCLTESDGRPVVIGRCGSCGTTLS